VANLFNDDDGLVDVPLELSLEDWGRVALLAHSQNLTINETITILLEEAVKKAEEIVDAASSSDVSNKKSES
jgi:macrodomain Ter protein organizer (MatP/YcbG family)